MKLGHVRCASLSVEGGGGGESSEFTSHAKQFENELENKLHNLIIGKSNLKFHLKFANYFCFNSDKNLFLPSQTQGRL